MKHYTIEYKMNSWDRPSSTCVLANNKGDAYDKAVFEEIPRIEGSTPYSAWVACVTYQNGNVKIFNTCEGMPY